MYPGDIYISDLVDSELYNLKTGEVLYFEPCTAQNIDTLPIN
jgi:hypothetical protein